MEIAVIAAAAGLALIGAYFATNLTNGTDDWAGQVKKAKRDQARMKQALEK
jgi:rhodanese-related sulfurtransferase